MVPTSTSALYFIAQKAQPLVRKVRNSLAVLASEGGFPGRPGTAGTKGAAQPPHHPATIPEPEQAEAMPSVLNT